MHNLQRNKTLRTLTLQLLSTLTCIGDVPLNSCVLDAEGLSGGRANGALPRDAILALPSGVYLNDRT